MRSLAMLGLAGALLVGAAAGATEPPTADGSSQPSQTQRVQPNKQRAARSAAERATPPSPIAEPYHAPPASYDVPHRAPTPVTQPKPQP